MTRDENELIHRLEDLASRSSRQGMYTQSYFLTEGEQALLGKVKSSPYFLEGGYPEAERKVAVFGSQEEFGYPWESTLCILKIAPKDRKFADPLTHRDFLGALLNLGIKRELLGDILIFENEGFCFALQQIAGYIEENLERVRHTSVKVLSIPHLPEGARVRFEERCVITASARLDAILSAVWNLSRAEGKEMVEKEMVSVSGKTVTDPAREVVPGERISLRGKGRFYFDGMESETRKGRCRMKVRVFV